MTMDTFSPFETNHADISASIPPSQATVYLQWHFGSFHCALTWVIPLYRLSQEETSTHSWHILFFISSLPHAFHRLYPCLPYVLLTWLIMGIKDPCLIRGMSSILYWDIRSQIPSVQKTVLMHSAKVPCVERLGAVSDLAVCMCVDACVYKDFAHFYFQDDFTAIVTTNPVPQYPNSSSLLIYGWCWRPWLPFSGPFYAYFILYRKLLNWYWWPHCCDAFQQRSDNLRDKTGSYNMAERVQQWLHLCTSELVA